MRIWTKRSKPHWSEVKQDYSEFLSMEEWIRKGNSVSKTTNKIIKLCNHI